MARGDRNLTTWVRGASPPLVLVALAALAASVVPTAPTSGAAAVSDARSADACPSGFMTYADFRLAEQRMKLNDAGDPAGALREAAYEQLRQLEATTGQVVAPDLCIPVKHPESLRELMLRAADRAAPRAAGAPGGAWAQGAFASALAERESMSALAVPPGAGGRATPYGKGPLVTSDTRYGTSGLGLVDNMGRVDDYAYNPNTGRLYAAVGTGGIWYSDDQGDSWHSLNANLPNQTSSAVAWSPHGGGTLVAVSGDHTYGSYAFTGTGAYYSRDGGASWQHANGVPNGALGFAAEAHPTEPNEFYLATSLGLYRSTDGGANFAMVPLDVGPTRPGGATCTGVNDLAARPDCTFANHVTDVAIQEPGGTTGVTEPIVVAAVGWRGGTHVAEGTDVTQSPNNGIYRSTDGGATFTYVAPPPTDTPVGFTEKERIGRTELGAAIGPDQNHGFLYAIVQDAVALNGGVNYVDAPEGEEVDEPSQVAYVTVLEGIYVSNDFGASWVRMADDQDFQSPTSGSSLIGTIPLGFAPGVQAWYNSCVQPDPTRADAVTGAPTRLIVCLEEVWQNENTSQPMVGPTSFKVIGRYFSGQTCAFLLNFEPCPTDRDVPNTLTTHPDQHDAFFIPEADTGGVTLMIGNDGGAYRQTVAAGEEFDNDGWGPGKNAGFNTLLPYHAATAKDGTVWFGLQDNGTAKIDPEPNPAVDGEDDPRDGQRFLKYQTLGGDGFFVAVDPDNSKVAYGETPFADMRVTSDGGQTWSGVAPGVANSKFSNPFVMDPALSTHLITGGRQIAETVFGPGTTSPPAADDPLGQTQPTDWQYVFDLGTAQHPGDPSADATDTDPANSMSAIDVERDAAYVGFCGTCDILNSAAPFKNGIATNVAGDEAPSRMTSRGWHFASAEGLPNRYVTHVQIDPTDTRTVYVTLGGYTRDWTPPGSLGDDNPRIGEGHLFVSHDAGETFTDITSNLPDVTATWVALRGERQLIVGTDIGAFMTGTDGVTGTDSFVPMPGLPAVPVSSVEVDPGDPDRLTVATYGRGIWRYRFDDPIAGIQYERVRGPERIATSVAVSQEQFDSGSDTVVLARADVFADALAGAPLAMKEGAPIVLTYPDRLHDLARAEVQRLGARRAFVLGGESALTPQVVADLQAAGVNDVVRLGGTNRYDTARVIGAEMLGSDGVAEDAYVVEGADADPTRGWPDAMSVSALAASQGRPILLVETDRLPAETTKALDDFGTVAATFVGGPVAISEEVRTQVEDRGVARKEIAGATRYETSAKIAEIASRERLDDARIWLATGAKFPDALSAGPTVAQNGGILLLVDKVTLDRSPASRMWLREHSPDIRHVRFVGGPDAISPETEAEVRQAIILGPPPEGPVAPLVGEVIGGPYGFETGADGWTTSTNKITTRWQVAPPGDTSGQSFQIPVYDNESTASLVSPAISHQGGQVRVTWSQRTNTEEGFDFLTLEWSVGGQIYHGVAGFSGMNEGYPQFAPQEVTFDAPPGDLFLRFKFSSDQLVSQEGVYVDNVTVER